MKTASQSLIIDSPKKRILIFVHFNPRADLSGHVLFTLAQIHRLFTKIIFISNSPLTTGQQEKLQPYVDRVIIRQNTGYDFSAWKEGIMAEGWATLQSYDSLTLMNDSCFGPLSDLAPYYQRMEAQEPDFWGITQHRPCRPKIGRCHYRIPGHLQSYFIVFHRPVLEAEVFQHFWNQVIPLKSTWDVILRYEIHLTGTLTRAGFSAAAVFDSGQEVTVNPNAAHYHPRLLIGRNVPFLKIKSFFFSQQPHELVDLVRIQRPHLAELIEEHVSRQFPPDHSLRVVNKTLAAGPAIPAPISAGSAAIHLDVRDTASLTPWLKALLEALTDTCSADVYITAPAGNAYDEIKHYIETRKCAHLIRQIISVPEDHHPWIDVSNTMSAYDVAGYFLVKQTTATDHPEQRIRHEIIATCLIGGMAGIRACMEKHPEVGIVLSDEPACTGWPDRPQDRPNAFELITEWLQQLSLDHVINLDINDSLLTPYASCFWYRPLAIEPLNALFCSMEWRQPQHLVFNTDLALAMLPVYIAWAQGYDFRIAADPKRLQTHFYTQMIREDGQRILREYMTTLHQEKMARPLVLLMNALKRVVINRSTTPEHLRRR